MNNAGLSTKHRSFINKANGFNVETDNSPDPKTVISTWYAQLEMQLVSADGVGSESGVCRLG